MIDYHRFCQIKDLHAHQGLNASQIAKALALDPRTVAYWLAQDHFRPRQPRQVPSKLDPFKPEIVRLLERYPYSAAQVFQRLREHGFDGGYSMVKAYVRTVRPTRQPAFLKLAFAPGECAQVDWGSFGAVPVGQTSRRLSFFVMVLCYSRMLYAEFTVAQTMEHFLACHQHAFEFFGGIPKKVMVDNLKSAVLKRALGEAPVLNPKYLDFARHHGFTIAPCNVGKGNEKGRVENGVGYVKKNFLAGLDLPDFSALNPAARQWLDTVANVRLHSETRQQPVQAWHTERPSLSPLPLHPFDIATVSQVRASRQFRITLDTNHYSVPPTMLARRSRSKPIQTGCASIWETSSLPVTSDGTIDSKMWKIPITPSRSWSTAERPAITSSSGAFSPSRRAQRPIISNLKRGASIPTIMCAKSSP